MDAEAAKILFESTILPAFKVHYSAMDDKTQFFVDEENNEIDGAGSPGLVQLSRGACDEPDWLVNFAIAHETAHGVVFLECNAQGVSVPQAQDYGRKKHEAWAGLIATKVLMAQLPDVWALVEAQLHVLANKLGGSAVTASHPTGNKRVELIREYASAYVQAETPKSKGFLRTIFCCGSAPNNPVLRREKAFNSCFKKINNSTNF
ncbi:hypothetical protein [Ectopseudomonas mendocina]|uniref:hypothetical protein n=1 Tax=Ectopseudomonas mendocina TaxID=300 RepID=UPI00131A567C|nr:hypothetical protein [Pseudomonas mendocina]